MNRRLFKMVALFVLLLSGSVIVGANTVKLTVWDYVDWRVDFYRAYAEQYMKENPHVDIEVALLSSGEYVDKIKVGIATDTAPTLFNHHPSYIADFPGLTQPLPEDLFPYDQLSEQILGFDFLVHEDGNVYFYPLGVQGPMLFINKDRWDEQGIGAPPRTWEEAVDMGRRSTRTQDGITSQAGFFFSDHDMMRDLFTDLNYQFGGTFYTDDGSQIALSDRPGVRAVGLINDMYRTGISGIGGENLDFRAGKVVMRYGMAWRQQQWDVVADLRYDVAPLPTQSGELEPGMSKLDYYLGLAVPVGIDPTEAREGFKFLHWAYENDERLMELNSRSGTLPARMSLWREPEIRDNRIMYTLVQTLPHALFPGEYPNWMMNMLQEVAGAIRTESRDPVIALHDVTERINARLAEEPVWFAVH